MEQRDGALAGVYPPYFYNTNVSVPYVHLNIVLDGFHKTIKAFEAGTHLVNKSDSVSPTSHPFQFSLSLSPTSPPVFTTLKAL